MWLLLCLSLLCLSCLLCGCNGEEETTAHTHKWSEWKFAKEPTCTEDGTLQRTCSCGEKETKVAEAVGHLEFQLSEQGSYYIVKASSKCVDTCENAHIVIPETYCGLPVTDIAAGGFRDCKTLETIQIPNSITSIGNLAFRGCDSLTSVVIPDSVTKCGGSVFAYCGSLTTVVLSKGMKSIGPSAFTYCSSLKTIVIPANVRTIGDAAFYMCGVLNTVYYGGKDIDWDRMTISNSANDSVKSSAKRYYYSENEPTSSGRWWHYDANGNPVKW